MLELVKTADGSNTIYNSRVGENYHSKHGALQESRHVFVNAGLCYYLDNMRSSKVSPTGGDLEGASEGARVSILEVGFGTGLNFLLTADECSAKKILLDYTGIEAYPLTAEMISQTGYNQYVSPAIWQGFVRHYMELLKGPMMVNTCCQLQIAHCQLLDFNSEKQFDIIYYDAFAAASHPAMWDEAAIGHTIRFLKPRGVLVTYAITGNLKRTLKALNCKVEKLPGAPGKREMLRAVKLP